MRNKLLHALSNRNGPFSEPTLVGDPAFEPFVYEPELERLREVCFLHRTDTDYYLKTYLSAFAGHPDVQALFDETHVTYDPIRFSPFVTKIEGAELASLPGAYGRYVERVSETLPVELTYRIRYLNASFCQIKMEETGQQVEKHYTIFTHSGSTLMRINWGELPFDGPLIMFQNWGAGAEIVIRVSPGSFPFKTLVRNMRSVPGLQVLLKRYNLTAEFAFNQDPVEQAVLALAVLALDNKSVFP